MDNIASRSLARGCQESPERVLPVAVKLRDKVLFKECIMCVINPWSLDGERIGMIEDEKIRAIAQNAYDTIEKRVNRVLRKILDCVGAHEISLVVFVFHIYFYLVTEDKDRGYFKEASDKWEIDGLMRINDSRFAFPGQVAGRDEAVLDHFLNVYINDADPPWDPAEKVWENTMNEVQQGLLGALSLVAVSQTSCLNGGHAAKFNLNCSPEAFKNMRDCTLLVRSRIRSNSKLSLKPVFESEPDIFQDDLAGGVESYLFRSFPRAAPRAGGHLISKLL
ncbi:hypothetical protein DL95DRAFT_461399 [Leptodontidium sp. 2 PMI_412]|nr:hypothetical protein DL95DRAFT_461399 [Leptodontidium sp. 2 PMI_412]